MQTKTIAASTVKIILLVSFSTVAFASNGDMGLATDPLTDGSENSPYLIEDFADFLVFANPNNSAIYWAADVHTRLDCDLDLDPSLSGRQTYTTAVIAPDTDSSEVYFQGTVFSGIFDGNDHIISNLTIDTAGVAKDYLALFGEIRGENAEVKNISVVNHKIITGDGYPEFSGGLVGRNFNGSISNCCAIGSITGGDRSENFGGLCGHNDFGTISDCYAAGSVTGSGCDYLGGLCGQTYGNIINCYATTTVVGKDESWNLGGLCGDNTGTISNCYAKGSVISRNDDSVYLGGLCGENSGLISNCYAAGVVAAGTDPNYVGGLCGKNNEDGYISNCFWDNSNRFCDINTCCSDNGICCWDDNVSGMTTSDGGTGLPTAQMQKRSTFVGANWDFITTWNIGENQTYPYLRTGPASD